MADSDLTPKFAPFFGMVSGVVIAVERTACWQFWQAGIFFAMSFGCEHTKIHLTRSQADKYIQALVQHTGRQNQELVLQVLGLSDQISSWRYDGLVADNVWTRANYGAIVPHSGCHVRYHCGVLSCCFCSDRFGYWPSSRSKLQLVQWIYAPCMRSFRWIDRSGCWVCNWNCWWYGSTVLHASVSHIRRNGSDSHFRRSFRSLWVSGCTQFPLLRVLTDIALLLLWFSTQSREAREEHRAAPVSQRQQGRRRYPVWIGGLLHC